ncbi:hypothetical protein F8O07_06775 [Pseudoclavibacter sp. CFCC 13796]|uniref:hypothetical protein n=1 Tax=Pseudoclavibacter sp. CFCC 13796 TaxID=2615179 RepID=UPI001300CEEB|nr:hypothetical protein [Pseudoclavibacter sp. CFCC 13796]KAB1661602.1 hypothetical protein F8O07_06775 [Pseudoclavibacter sp. CFCC 13796]
MADQITVTEHDGRLYVGMPTPEGVMALEVVEDGGRLLFDPVTEADERLCAVFQPNPKALVERIGRYRRAMQRAVAAHHPLAAR